MWTALGSQSFQFVSRKKRGIPVHGTNCVRGDKFPSFSRDARGPLRRGFRGFGDVGGVGAVETLGHGFGRDEMDRWHLMIFQRRRNRWDC